MEVNGFHSTRTRETEAQARTKESRVERDTHGKTQEGRQWRKAFLELQPSAGKKKIISKKSNMKQLS